MSIGALRSPARRITPLLALAILAGAVGCVSQTHNGEQIVFAVQTGIRETGPINRDEINDVGLPPLQNVSGRPVRIRSVQWVDKPAAVHILSVVAYNIHQTGTYVNSMEGDLPVACPHQYRPRPLGSFVTAAHANTGWYVVIAFTISKLGRYYMNKVKITYTADGKPGWQYQNVDQEFTVVNPPLPGPIPIPRSGICG